MAEHEHKRGYDPKNPYFGFFDGYENDVLEAKLYSLATCDSIIREDEPGACRVCLLNVFLYWNTHNV